MKFYSLKDPKKKKIRQGIVLGLEKKIPEFSFKLNLNYYFALYRHQYLAACQTEADVCTWGGGKKKEASENCQSSADYI